ncbi:MAG: sigma-70 family RNA polymerase sigma factor [Bacilli bacterium]|nr:sigma-70 family RNA polymerase sigma factor [Bacilli bacterium]
MDDELVLNNIKLIYKCIKDMNCHYETEDEFQNYYDAGLEGLIRGAKTYDPTISKPSTYLYKCIKQEITKYFYTSEMDCRKINKIHKTSIDEVVYDNSDITYAEIIPDPNTNIEQEIEDKIKIEAIVKCLNFINDKDAMVIKKYFGLDGKEPMTIREIAKEMNISSSMVGHRKKRGIRMIKNHIDKVERNLLMNDSQKTVDSFQKPVTMITAEQYRVVKQEQQEKLNNINNMLDQANEMLFEQMKRLKELDTTKKEEALAEIQRGNALSNASKTLLQTIGIQMAIQKQIGL